MILSQFIDALDLYGSALDDWPAGQRAAAMALLAISDEAAEALAEARWAESFVRANDPADAIGPDAVIRLQNAVLAQVARQPPERRSGWSTAFRRLGLYGARLEWAPRFAIAIALAAVLGVTAGDHLSSLTAQQRVSASEMLAMSTSYLPLETR